MEEATLLLPAYVQQPASLRQQLQDVSARPMRPAPPSPAAELAWLLSQQPPSSPLAPPSYQVVAACCAALPAPASPALAPPPDPVMPLLQPAAPLPPPPPLPTAHALLPERSALLDSGGAGARMDAQRWGQCPIDDEVLALIEW